MKKLTVKERRQKIAEKIVYEEHYYYDKKGELLIERVSLIPKNWYKKNKFD